MVNTNFYDQVLTDLRVADKLASCIAKNIGYSKEQIRHYNELNNRSFIMPGSKV